MSGPTVLRVLVVDDDEVDRAAVRRALAGSGLGVEVHEADHARDALAQAAELSFDCVFLDYNLPGEDGLHVLRALRTAGVGCPVIALTGHGDELIAAELMKAGAIDYLPKSIATAERLVQSLRQARRVHEAEARSRRASERLQFLAAVSTSLAASLDRQATLENVVRLCGVIADCCLVHMPGQEGALAQVAFHHCDPAVTDRMADLVACATADLSDPNDPLASVFRNGRSELIENVPAAPSIHDHSAGGTGAILRLLGARSVIAVPLTSRGRTHGVLTLLRGEAERGFTEDDLSLAEQLGQRAAVALDNADLYEEARQAVRARNDVLAVVSHDLRNPLNVIIQGAALILELPLPPEAQRRQVEAIKRSGERMNRLIEDLLDVMRLDAGSFTIDPRPHEVAAVVTEACDLLRLLAEQKSIQLDCRLEDPPPAIAMDRDRILQVLANLIGNAIKFTAEGGRVRVDAAAGEEEIVFSVTDSGPGIPPEDLRHLFDRFWQGNRTGRGTREGTGLGLTIARGIVEAHGGRIWAVSEVGTGSTFHFSLPAGMHLAFEAPLPVTIG